MKANVKPVPDGYHTAAPYLTVADANAALDFYKRAFGAKELFRLPGPGGKLVHSEMMIGDSHVMVADESGLALTRSPQSLNGTTASVFLYIEDVDSVFQQAVRAGAKEDMAPQDMFWGDRFARLTDPFGHHWMLASHIEDVSPEEMARRAAKGMK
jgi:PhnB protein